MRFIFLIATSALLLGCLSTSGMHRLYAPKTQEVEAHSMSQYVYRGAQVAAEKGADKYALILKVNSKREPSIWVFLIGNENDLKELHQKVQDNKDMKLLDIFDTDEYVDRRYTPAYSVPGLA